MSQTTIFDVKRRLYQQKYGMPEDSWSRFREYLVVDAVTTLPTSPNWEASALFDAIQLAFDGSHCGGKTVEIDPYLIHNLAVCARIALRYDADVTIDWSDHDDVVKRTYNGFAHTVIKAIQRGNTVEMDGKNYFGALSIPDYFFMTAKNLELD